MGRPRKKENIEEKPLFIGGVKNKDGTAAKKTVLFSFDDDLILDTRRILFKKNLVPQQFITYLFHRLRLNDDLANKVMQEAAEFYQKEMLEQTREDKGSVLGKHSKNKKNRVINKDILYDIIESGGSFYDDNKQIGKENDNSRDK